MKTVSLKIDNDIFGETEEILAKVKKPRNRYINEALAYYNRLQQRILLENKLQKETDPFSKDVEPIEKAAENNGKIQIKIFIENNFLTVLNKSTNTSKILYQFYIFFLINYYNHSTF
jgi:hypothetical protein